MSKLASRHLAWNADLARYQLGEQMGQGLAVSEGDVERDAWQEWLELVPSFSFQGKDGHHFTALKERRARGGAYWTAYRKINGKLERKYLGSPQEVTLARLEHVAAALAEPKTRERQETWHPQGPPHPSNRPVPLHLR